MNSPKRKKPDATLPSAYSVILLGITIAGLVLIGACKDSRPAYCQGYYEADLLYIAAPVSGYLTRLATEKGTNVTAGQLVFALEPSPETYQADQAAAQVSRADALLADSRKGARPDQIDALQAALEQAQALSEMARLETDRLAELRKDNMVSENDYDRARLQYQANQQAVQQAQANLAEAKLAAREDQIKANQAQLEANQQAEHSARWTLGQKTQQAPRAGIIYDTYYRQGEWVPAARPVASLLAPELLKVNFYAPEEMATGIQIGQTIYVKNNYSRDWDTATVSYVSPDPEFTPPVIFSRDTDSKLVFLFEARPDKPDITRMHPGQPVEVYLEKPAAVTTQK
jgi:HlyD family secretion protein